MKKVSSSITIDQDIANSQEYIKLASERKLSQLINNLLRTALNVQKYEVPQDQADIDNELQKLNTKLAILTQKKEDLKKAEEKEKARWHTVQVGEQTWPTR